MASSSHGVLSVQIAGPYGELFTFELSLLDTDRIVFAGTWA